MTRDDDRNTPTGTPLMWGSSAVIRLLHARARAFATSSETVAIFGERGTGKTRLAQAIHAMSGRSGQLVALPITNTPDDLLLGELFGHSRGAYTGAHSDQPGLAETASNGTLFLDELGLASPAVQRSLLTLFDGGGFRRLGESRRRPFTGRIIVATNENLEERSAQGTFRRDLHDRLGYLALTVPPLRQRLDEILPLFVAFLASHECGGDASGLARPVTLSAEVEQVLLSHSWSGNVRQLDKVAGWSTG